MSSKISDIVTRVQNYSNTISQSRFDSTDIIQYTNDYVAKMQRKHNLPWTKTTTPLYVFPNVFNYAVPDDFKNFVAPQLPLTGQQRDTTYYHYTTQPEFARKSFSQNGLAMDFDFTTKLLLVNYSDSCQRELLANPCDAVDDNGHWIASGDASNLQTDSSYFRYGNGSLQFDITNATGISLISNTTVNPTDITAYKNGSYPFLSVYIPVANPTIQYELQWGSSSSDYFPLVFSEQFTKQPFSVGWNLLGGNWFDLTPIGTPDLNNMTYLGVKILNAVTASVYRINGFFFRKWVEQTLPYYSSFNFQSNGSLIPDKNKATALDDVLLGDNEYIDMAVFFNVMSVAKWKFQDSDLLSLAKADFDEAMQDLMIRYPDLQPMIQTEYFNTQYLDDYDNSSSSGSYWSRW